MSQYVEFIPKAGACLATKNVMSGAGVVRWMVREPSQAHRRNSHRAEDPPGRAVHPAEVPAVTRWSALCL